MILTYLSILHFVGKAAAVMTKMKQERMNMGRAVRLSIVLCILLLVLSSFLATLFISERRKSEVLSKMDISLNVMAIEYRSILDNFWQVYMPLFENKDVVNAAMKSYFSQQELSPQDKTVMVKTLGQMVVRDNRAKWIAIYDLDKLRGHILFEGEATLIPFDESFPYWSELTGKSSQMEVYGTKTLNNSSGALFETFAICGGLAQGTGNGGILVGYSINSLKQIGAVSQSNVLLGYYAACAKGIVLKTDDFTEADKLYTRSIVKKGGYAYTYTLSSRIKRSELFIYIHKYTPLILGIAFFSALIFYLFYRVAEKSIGNKVNLIRNGLDIIGDNQLSYRIPVSASNDEFAQISAAINDMAAQLQENINRVYQYRLRQQEAELAELQAKFNPHFLYNCLELLRSRTYRNGDTETAAMIVKLSAIFRGLIGAGRFISIREELSFMQNYLSLFKARYGDMIRIIYDMEPEVLDYCIIRNLLQPIIENYFVHGIGEADEESYLAISGRMAEERYIVITVKDNGAGMSQEDIARLMDEMEQPDTEEHKSYGLKNIYRRVKLFYGEDCGLLIRENGEKGLEVGLTLLKMTYEEHEERWKAI